MPDINPRINYLSPKDRVSLRGASVLFSAKSGGGGCRDVCGAPAGGWTANGLICMQGASRGPGSAQARTLLDLAGQSWRQEEDTRAGGELAPEKRASPLP